MSKLFDLIPTDIKIVLALGIVALLGVGVFSVYNKIDQGGYDRRVQEEKDARSAADKQARSDIIGVSKKYDDIKEKVHQKVGPNDPVGPRVEFAIDSLPSPSGSDGQ